MNYQAAYLQEKQLPETINNLADDNHHAFNEFLRRDEEMANEE